MLLAMTGLAILFAVARWWSAPLVVFVVFFLIAIALHVAGNALGMQLRRNRGRDPIPGSDPATGMSPSTREALPPTKLGDKLPLGLPIWILSIGISITAAISGCIWTWYQHGRQAGLENYLVAALAFGLLGAIWSFLTIGFLQVTISAILQAIRGHAQEQQRMRDREQGLP